MIHRDRVTVKYEVPYDPPRYGNLGVEEYQTISETVPATVTALDSDRKVDLLGSTVQTRFLIVLPPHAFPSGPPNAAKVKIEWRTYAGTKALRVDGAIEPHMLGSRLDHYEIITKSVVS